MTRQRTDWGEILWLEEESGTPSSGGLEAGIVTLPSGSHQAKHIHYNEQVIYVLQGQAVSWIDGVKSILSPGGFFHWRAGVEHEVMNTGDVSFRHLLVSSPGLQESEPLFPDREKKADVSPDLIYTAVEAIRTQFLETLHYGYAIFDSLGNLIVQSPLFPEYCVRHCDPGNQQGGCSCMRQLDPKEWSRETVFRCRYGMELFHYPIFFEKVFLGYIHGGYIRHSGGKEGRLENVYDVPDSVVTGIRALLGRIVKAIRNYCEFEQFRRELLEKELRITSQEESQRILMKNLRDTQYAMTDLKINNHFLFNTLNSMASMALDGGLMPLYQSIVDLSRMFHYTLRTQNPVVLLEKEMKYVQAYLQLQKLRYGESLQISFRIDARVQKAFVPFNFLQPVVENAFVHGFEESVQKRIRIEIVKKCSSVEIKVINSGKTLSPQACRSINQGIRSNTSHGLSMIRQKLYAAYGEQCTCEIASLKNGDTCVWIRIPFRDKDMEGGGL